MKVRSFLASLIVLSCMFALPMAGVAEEPVTFEETSEVTETVETTEVTDEVTEVVTDEVAEQPVEEETAKSEESGEEKQASESEEPTEESNESVEPIVDSEEEFDKEASLMTADNPDEVTVVYLGGKGKDTNDGLTIDTPVQTFVKAKEILSKNGGTIYVVSTVEVTKSEEWDGKCENGSIFITRADDFNYDPMVRVQNYTTEFTLTNLVLDGGSDHGMKITGTGNYQQVCSIIDMASGRGGGKLVLGEGAVLQNNYAYQTSVGKSNVRGGAITVQPAWAYRQYINIDGGTIKNCTTSESGGAIYGLYYTVVNLISGSIENCHAINNNEDAVEYGYGNGGGIYLYGAAILNVKGGEIKDCTSSNYGGGAFLDYSTFKMSGGSFESNTAGLCGGGLLLGNETDGHITAGSFINNIANGADANNDFAGGGIYVASHLDGDNGDSTLEIQNLVVSDNYAKNGGGGIAVCGFGDATLADGAAIFNNTSSVGVKDLFMVSGGDTTPDGMTHHGEETKRFVSPTMLGGGLYNWKDINGKLMDLTKLLIIEKSFYGNANPSGKSIDAAEKAGTTFFKGNQAPNGYGGGIANNGILTVGEVGDVDFSVEKTWNDNDFEDARPSKLKVSVKQNGKDYGFVYVTKDDDGNWKTEFKGLPKFDVDGNEYKYEIEETLIFLDDKQKEVEVKGKEYTYQAGEETKKVTLLPCAKDSYAYKASYEKLKDKDGNKKPASFKITNEYYKAVQISKTDITGTKEIGDAKLELKDENGEIVDTWTSEEGKSHTLFLKDGTYTLSEIEVPEHYVKADDITFTVLGDKITVNNEKVEKIVMKDDYTEHEFRVIKTNLSNHPLTDGKFVLSLDKEGKQVIATWTSTMEAYALSLKPGTYYLKETEAPKGYKKVSGLVEIVMAVDGSLTVKTSAADAKLVSYDKDTVTITVKNDAASKPPVPNTSDAGLNAWVILLCVSLAVLASITKAMKHCA